MRARGIDRKPRLRRKRQSSVVFLFRTYDGFQTLFSSSLCKRWNSVQACIVSRMLGEGARARAS
jgi:hypothetical protein